MASGWSKRTVLRAGYGAVIAVLVLSTVEAYRIQVTVSRQHLEIYRHFVEQEDALSTLRRNLWLAGNHVRDFFIQNGPQQGNELITRLRRLEEEDETALQILARSPSHRAVVPELRRSIDEFWVIAKRLPQTMMQATNGEEMAFLAREVVPRRGELYNALRQVTLADQRMLENSEGEFAGTRRHAAERLLLMLCLGVLLSVTVTRISLRHAENLEREADRHFAAVEKAKQELQQLSARLLEIEEEGKRRLSRELHDEIGQSLALLQIEISHAQAMLDSAPSKLEERLSRARELAERTVQSIRNISGLLRPALLDDLGLVPALQFQLEEFLRRSGIACEFIEDSVEDQLPDAVKTCVYRVVQEALHNCEKHAGAHSVRVTVRQLNDHLMAEVEDDGCGFTMGGHRSSGLGLLGMRERSVNAGGSLIIDSSPGHGTRIALRIPLARSKREVNA
ncbi:MAG: sensor histidine kinase [Candidatus Solibacter sp.]